ncbi:MAG: putative quinol monooxygenase [Gammaproteobacteria bacterium]
MAIGAFVTMRAKPGKESELIALFKQMQAAIHAGEPGTRYYDLFASRKDPLTFHLLEKYEDKAALKAHMQSEGFKSLGARLGEVADGPPEIVMFDEL